MEFSSYATIQKETLQGKELERSLLERVTARLRAADTASVAGTAALHDALRLNRNVWMTFASDLAAPDHPFPDELKASMLSIASYVERNTFAAANQDSVLSSFIDINVSIMAGLGTSTSSEMSGT